MDNVKYNLIVLFAFCFWIAETWYFGWNWEAESVQEKLADGVVVILFVWGIVGDWMSNITFVKKTSVTLNPGQKIEDVL